MNDPIADLLTRIRNAYASGKTKVVIPISRVKQMVAQILSKNGYVGKVIVGGKGKDRKLTIDLKNIRQMPAVTEMKRVSKPGRRVYKGKTELPRVLSGAGMAIVSTSQGMMSDQDARKKGLGGEVVAIIW